MIFKTVIRRSKSGSIWRIIKQFPVQDSYKKVETFMEIMKKNYPHIETVYIPIEGLRILDEIICKINHEIIFKEVQI